MSTYIRTWTGRKLDILDLRPDDIDIKDIAHSLAKQPRWAGQCNPFYSVAAHSIHVSRMVAPEHKLSGLMHDASEAFLADIPSPFKKLMPDYHRLEHALMSAIASKFGFTYPKSPEVEAADAAVLYLERKHLFTHPMSDDVPRVEVPKVRWNWAVWTNVNPAGAEFAFLHEFENIRKDCCGGVGNHAANCNYATGN